MSKVILIGELPLNILIRSNGSVALEPCDRIGPCPQRNPR